MCVFRLEMYLISKNFVELFSCCNGILDLINCQIILKIFKRMLWVFRGVILKTLFFSLMAFYHFQLIIIYNRTQTISFILFVYVLAAFNNFLKMTPYNVYAKHLYLEFIYKYKHIHRTIFTRQGRHRIYYECVHVNNEWSFNIPVLNFSFPLSLCCLPLQTFSCRFQRKVEKNIKNSDTSCRWQLLLYQQNYLKGVCIF